MAKVEELIEILSLIREGKYNVSYFEILQNTNVESSEIIFEAAVALFENQYYEQALSLFVRCHSIFNYLPEDIFNIVNECYYIPNKDSFSFKYNENIEILKTYEYAFNFDSLSSTFESLDFMFIPYTDTRFAVYSKSRKRFIGEYDKNAYIKESIPKDTAVCLSSIYKTEKIKHIIQMTESDLWFNKRLDIKKPIYLYYQELNEFLEYLCVMDLKEIINSERIVFCFSEVGLEEALFSRQMVFPTRFSNESNKMLVEKITTKFINKTNDLEAKAVEIFQNYNSDKMIEKIRTKKVKILFYTTRYSTAIKYYIRDISNAVSNIGIENKTLIEDSNIKMLRPFDIYNEIIDFRPDMIFIIGYFRFQLVNIPSQIIFLTWLQDYLPHIMNKETPKKLLANDFMLNVCYSDDIYKKLGYPEKKMFPMPAFTDLEIYKSYSYTREEYDEFSADIYIISAASDYYSWEKYFEINKYSEPKRIVFRKLAKSYYQKIYNGEHVLGRTQIEEDIVKGFNELNIPYTNEEVFSLTTQIQDKVIVRIYKTVVCEWLIEKGYNIKLWGNEWADNPKFKNYNMGLLKNGEEMSKKLNMAKISIGISPYGTAHPRIYEATLSNCLYLGLGTSEEDRMDIRKLVNIDEGIILFYNKQDLYNKIDKYLSDEEERIRMLKKGQKLIKEKLNYEKYFERVLKYLESNIE